MCVHVHVSVIYSCRWLAYAFVCVNVALTVRAGVCHILEVINQTGNQAAAEITPGNEEQMDKMSCRKFKHVHVKKKNGKRKNTEIKLDACLYQPIKLQFTSMPVS